MNKTIRDLETIRDTGIVNHQKDTKTLQEAIDLLKGFTWRSPEEPPKEDEYVLVSFANYTLPDIARYSIDDEENGAYYPGDEDRSYVSYGLYVDGWMPMPKNVRDYSRKPLTSYDGCPELENYD